MVKLKISTASRRKCPSWKKIVSVNHAGLTWSKIFAHARNSNCLGRKILPRKKTDSANYVCLTQNNPIDKEHFDKLNIPTALSKNFQLRNKTDSTNHAVLKKQSSWSKIFAQAENCNCLDQKSSNTKENKKCKPCMPNKTIQLNK